MDNLTIQDNKILIFADISPAMIMKRRSLKPLLEVLNRNSIKYRWSFPFRLELSYKDRSYGFTNLQNGERLLLQLGLIAQEPSSQQDEDRQINTSKRPPPNSPLTPLWIKEQSKRHRDSIPPWWSRDLTSRVFLTLYYSETMLPTLV